MGGARPGDLRYAAASLSACRPGDVARDWARATRHRAAWKHGVPMIRRLAAGILVLLVGACAQIPTAEFGQYQKAFNEVEKSSTDIFVTYDQILARARLFVATTQKAPEGTEIVEPYPVEFEDFLKKLNSQEGHDIDVRRQALTVVGSYNAVLLQLVQGKSIDDVQTAAGELVTGLGKFVEAAAGSAVPGFEAVASLAKTFAGQ